VTTPPAVVVHDAEQARMALAASGPDGVTLLSAPGAAGSLGAPWFQAIVAAAVASHPSVPHCAVLDCADAPGHVLAALQAGLRWLVVDPFLPAFPQLEAAAAECGATLLAARPAALDLARIDFGKPGGRRLLAQWLSPARDDIGQATS
jgi:hypothetical protein